jgi:hypothetical protein
VTGNKLAPVKHWIAYVTLSDGWHRCCISERGFYRRWSGPNQIDIPLIKGLKENKRQGERFSWSLLLKNNSVPAVDVMIAIFSDFQQVLAKKLAFFSKTNGMINFCA